MQKEIPDAIGIVVGTPPYLFVRELLKTTLDPGKEILAQERA
jgi:hypothetical protein